MGWIALQPNLPSSISSLGSAITTALNAVKAALNVLKAEVQVAQQLVVQTEGQAAQQLNQAVQQVVAQINILLNNLLDNTGLYALIIPLPKKGFVRIATSELSQGEPGSNYLQFPATQMLTGLSPSDAAALQSAPLFQQIFNPSELFLGGNAYFVKTVCESIFDVNDPSRPTFQIGDNWAYACMVAGAPDVTQVLSLATYLDRLLGGAAGGNSGQVSASRNLVNVVPQLIRVGPAARGAGAVVQWDQVIPQVTLESFDNVAVTATEFAVIRSTDFRAMSARRVTDLFPTTALTAGMTGQYGATVLAVQAYDGVFTRYNDANVGSDVTDPAARRRARYYYQVAFRTQVQSPGADPVDQGYDRLSACVAFNLGSSGTTNVSARPGKLPDWNRTPSLASLFPPLSQLVGQVQEQLNSLASGAQNVTTRNQQYVNFIDAEVANFTRKATEFSNYTSQVQGIFAGSGPGLFSTIRSGSGGIASFVSDLTTAFSDASDPNRPSFDLGDEYVVGAILLGVGPDVSALLAALGLFFGPPPSAGPLAAGVQSIATAVAAAEQAAIDASLGPNENAGTPSNTFNQNLSPNPGGADASCTTTAPSAPVIGDDLKPVR